MDEQTDKGPRQQRERHIVDGLPDIAKVRVAGSNPVVRSEKSWWEAMLAMLGYFAVVSFGSQWEYRCR